MRFRYSLRALLLVVTLIAVVLGWLAMPTIQAQRFAAAIHAKDYGAAEQLFAGKKEVFPGRWKDHTYFEPRALIKSLTWRDIWNGERRLVVGVAYGDGSGIASCTVEVKATASGLEQGMAIP